MKSSTQIIVLILSSLLLSAIPLFADDCSDALTEAKREYNAGNYNKARELFVYIQEECGNSYGASDQWIQKCDEASNPSSNSAQSTSSSPTSASSSKQASQPTLSVSETSIYASASGTTQYLTVSSNSAWEISQPTGSIYSVSRSGSNTLIVAINKNSTTKSRTDWFYVRTTDGSKTVKVTINQAAGSSSTSSGSISNSSSTSSSAYLSLSKTSLSSPAAGTTEYITISTNKEWVIVHPTGTMYSVTRYSSSMIKVVISPNNGGSRQDFFIIKTKDESKSVRVNLSQTQGSSSYSSNSGNSSYYNSSSSYSGNNKSRYRPLSYHDKVQRWYNYSGRLECAWWSPKIFIGTNWGVEMSALDFRLWLFEVDPLAFGAKLSYNLDYQFYYMPKVKCYIPMTNNWSASMAIGPSFAIDNYTKGYYAFNNPWFVAELAFRCHHWNSAVNTDLFIRYNEGFVVGVAWSFTKAWR